MNPALHSSEKEKKLLSSFYTRDFIWVNWSSFLVGKFSVWWYDDKLCWETMNCNIYFTQRALISAFLHPDDGLSLFVVRAALLCWCGISSLRCSRHQERVLLCAPTSILYENIWMSIKFRPWNHVAHAPRLLIFTKMVRISCNIIGDFSEIDLSKPVLWRSPSSRHWPLTSDLPPRQKVRGHYPAATLPQAGQACFSFASLASSRGATDAADQM